MARRLLANNLFKNYSYYTTKNLQIRNMTSESDVLFESVQNKGIITLNRPKALNALSLSMVEKLLPILEKWEHEKAMVLIKGCGGKAFCAGGDVRAVTEAGLRGETVGQEFFRVEYTINGMIGTYKVPYIAFIDGIVMGGGVGMSVHGQYRIATERTLFAMPETQIGLFPDVGGSYFLPRLGGKLGLYLALTGMRLKGSDVLKAGIATHYVKSERLKDLESALMDCCNEGDINETLRKFSESDVQEFSLKPCLERINACFNAHAVSEIMTNLENDGTEWAMDTLKLLKKMSPTSLCVSLEALRRGAKLNLLECLQMEYRIACHILNGLHGHGHDFFEGVRALLIDKDLCPKWKPATVQEVTPAYVDEFFAKLPDSQELKHKL